MKNYTDDNVCQKHLTSFDEFKPCTECLQEKFNKIDEQNKKMKKTITLLWKNYLKNYGLHFEFNDSDVEMSNFIALKNIIKEIGDD